MSYFTAKMHQIRFRLGRSPQTPLGGAYSDPPDPLAGFKGSTSKGREGEGKEWDRRGGEGKGEEGMEGEGRERRVSKVTPSKKSYIRH